MTAVVMARGLRRDFRLDDRPSTEVVHAVRGVTLDVAEGEWVAIAGPSGCGKSTLLNLLGGIDRPTSGVVAFRGRDLSTLDDGELTRFRLTNVGFVFQRFYLMPMLTARENVELPMAEAGLPRDQRAQRASELLRYVGLGARERHRPSQLSGGEQQRVAIARALANRPVLVLADEPTGELDARTGEEIISLFRMINGDGAAVIVVTHDDALAAAARRVIHMRDGAVVASAGSLPDDGVVRAGA
ncbi:MAG TPA: ABC transporter ATP-binding protein [Gemmatimonadaceae bacterium]|nr:ABC transporter ATP-binding protein [Gemmatimonadaceae bacterium]